MGAVSVRTAAGSFHGGFEPGTTGFSAGLAGGALSGLGGLGSGFLAVSRVPLANSMTCPGGSTNANRWPARFARGVASGTGGGGEERQEPPLGPGRERERAPGFPAICGACIWNSR